MKLGTIWDDTTHPVAVQRGVVWPSDPKYSGAKIGEYGVDGIASGSPLLLVPNDHVDLMSYCGPVWVSDWTYSGLYQNQRSTGGALQVKTVKTLMIRADLSENGEIALHPVYMLEAAPTDLPANSAYQVDLLDPAGNLLASYFVPVLEAYEPGLSIRALHALIPLPDSEVAWVRLSEVNGPNSSQQDVLGAQSTAQAIVPLVTQTPEMITLSWGMPDKPAIVRYTVDDGKSWSVLGLDVMGGKLQLDPGTLPGGEGSF